MHFEREFFVSLTAASVWQHIWNVQRIVSCVPGCAGAVEIEATRRYEATIIEKVGPFKVQVPLQIEISDAQRDSHITLRASGRDAKMGADVSFDLSVDLIPEAGGTRFRMAIDATVAGRLASLGKAVIQRKGEQQMDLFAQALKASLSAALHG